MIEDKKLGKELIRLLSAEGQPTRAVLAQTRVGVLFIRSVSDTILFLPKPPADHRRPPVVRGPQFQEHCTVLTVRHKLRFKRKTSFKRKEEE
jgi:hypothetical protein